MIRNHVDGERIDSMYLNLHDLEEGKSYKKVALVKGMKAGISVYESGYYTFYLKDCNASVVESRLFNVADFSKSGIAAVSLENKAVSVSFTAQVFNGRWSLILDSIELFRGSVNYEVFNKRVPGASVEEVLKDFDRIGDKTGVNPRDFFKTEWLAVIGRKSFSSLCNGATGSGLKIVQLIVNKIASYNDFKEIKLEELFDVLAKSIHYYFTFIAKNDDFSLIENSAKMEVYDQLHNTYKDSIVYECVLDTLFSLLGTDKPKHLYAHVIYDSFIEAKKMLDMIYLYEGLPLCSKTNFGGGVLLKY